MIRHAVRRIFSHFGFVVWKRNYLQFGIDPLLDIGRMSQAWGRKIETVFDVGANVGQFHAKVRAEFPDANIHSFEPHPGTFAQLSKFVEPPSRCYQLALGSGTGHAPFYVYREDAGSSRINSLTPEAGFPMQFGWKPDVIEVECATLDDFCDREKIEWIDLLKIDTEGHDLQVLLGSRRMLSEGRVTAVLVEFNNLLETAGSVGGDLLPIANFLAEFGLRFATSYTDDLVARRPMFLVANALFVFEPGMACDFT